MNTHRQTLSAGLQSLGLPLKPDVVDLLMGYVEMLYDWNQRMNLSGHKTLEKMIPYHLLDSLALLPHLPDGNVLDVGTGAGLPGIPLAIADPNRHYTLVDSRSKRLRFLREVCKTFTLTHVTPITDRVENIALSKPAQVVTARAVSDAGTIIQLTKHLIAPSGVWVLMKGKDPSEEMTGLNYDYHIIPLSVPGVDAERCLLMIHNKRTL